MSKHSQFFYSSTSSFDSMHPEKESVNNQLDRLNQVIQSLAIDVYSPDVSQLNFSPSYSSFQNFSRASFDEYECEFPEKICRGIEEFLLELDRAEMIKEDFRSMETRRIERKTGRMRKSEVVRIRICADEITELIRQLKRLEEKGSSGVEESISLLNCELKVTVIASSKFSVEKKKIAEAMANPIHSETYKFLDYGKFSRETNEIMQNVYNERFESSEIKLVNFNVDDIFSQSFCCIRNNYKHYQDLQLKSLEWQLCETSNAKSQYLKKLESVSAYEKEVISRLSAVQSNEYKLQTQRLILSKDIETILQYRKQLEKIRDENKKHILYIKGIISETISANPPLAQVSNKLPTHEKRSEIDMEMQRISEEILSLESILLSDKSNADWIQTKIDRLKTQQSHLKTLRVINASAERSSFVASRLKCFQTKKPLSSETFSENLPQSKRYPLKMNERCINKENFGSGLEDFQNYIKTQENRLVEKEQEINKREGMLAKWGQSNETAGIVSMLLNEQRNLKILRKDLDKRQKVLEAEILANLKKAADFVEKEQRLRRSIEVIISFIAEQTGLENILKSLFEMLECLLLNYSKTSKIMQFEECNKL